MNILLLTSAAPSRAGFSTFEKRPPLGLGILISVLKKEGHTIYFSDEYLQQTDLLDSDFLNENHIDFVGIYSNTVCFQSTLTMLKTLQRKRKLNEWGGKIMVGGPHATVGLETIPDCVDYVVIGEGEISVPKIIQGQLKPGIVRGEKVTDLDSLPKPAWEEFIYRSYDWTHKWYPTYPLYVMNTSRGCPFKCTFCSVRAIWGKSYRFMSAERIVSDIEYMIKYYGARGIYFREDHFTFNQKRTVEFCELLLQKGIVIDWFCETRVDAISDLHLQKLMKKAGCKVFYIGVESGSPKMLKVFKKGITVDQIVTAFEIARCVGIKTYASFVVGHPNENPDDVDSTVKLIDTIKPDYLNHNVFVGLPGSKLYNLLKTEKLYEYKDDNEILYPIGYKQNVAKYYGNSKYFHVY